MVYLLGVGVEDLLYACAGCFLAAKRAEKQLLLNKFFVQEARVAEREAVNVGVDLPLRYESFGLLAFLPG